MTFKPVYIIDGARTPFLKARNAPGPFSASELAVQTSRSLLLRQSFNASELDEVIVGCASPSADETNIGRVVGLRIGTGYHVPAWTVMRNCASGMQALDSALTNIQNGRSHLVLACGTDALSHAPILFSDKMVHWLSQWNAAQSTGQKIKALRNFRPAYLAPVIGLLKGLKDPVIGISMGQTAENLAWKFGITRQEMDAYSARSHQRTIEAQNRKQFDEITPIIDAQGNLYTDDDGVRRDSTPDKLAKLKAVFDRPSGNITAGNSSQVSDGAAVLILASEEAVQKWGLQPIGKITDCQWAALDPAQMGLGPVHACIPLLQRNGLRLQDPDLWEINEAFAAQVLGCIRAFASEEYCQEHFNTPAWGTLDQEKLNVDGGAIAIGHPVGASGARIVLHLLHALRVRNLHKGVATICIGGGQGGAMLIETMKDEP
ncbi:acetyl-CoA acetyltransferase [Advenella faeciporci]|uniref:Acetyl-CoA acetyltransferase n=1 Tax=Advenella faeciporci TaxID=797535 RepID=A0A918JFM3_9BURK|nr:acetyl-CoA C-acetyltransferase [Advenella faeciporci]GGW76628.1 acetyl-CoA acetyltransferase [Advenella faeciporci]